jgi:hypothetical protein
LPTGAADLPDPMAFADFIALLALDLPLFDFLAFGTFLFCCAAPFAGCFRLC